MLWLNSLMFYGFLYSSWSASTMPLLTCCFLALRHLSLKVLAIFLAWYLGSSSLSGLKCSYSETSVLLMVEIWQSSFSISILCSSSMDWFFLGWICSLLFCGPIGCDDLFVSSELFLSLNATALEDFSRTGFEGAFSFSSSFLICLVSALLKA